MAKLLILICLIAGLFVSIYVVKHVNTNLKSKAYDEPQDVQSTVPVITDRANLSEPDQVLVSEEFNSFARTYAEVITDAKQNIKLLIVPVETRTLKQKISHDSLSNLLFGNNNSLKNYFELNSYGQLTISGDVVKPINVDIDTSHCTDADRTLWVDAIDKKISTETQSYYSIIYVFPPLDSCKEILGAATLGKPKSSPAKSWILQYNDRLIVYAHELGHNFGLPDADFSNCIECNSQHQADPYDPMGLGYNQHNLSPFHFALPNKYKLGWIDADNMIEAKSNRIDYHIDPYESGQDQPLVKGILIPRPDAGDYYLLEYRQKLNFDSQLPDDATQGVILHISRSIAIPRLINPNAPDDTSVILHDGKEFRDSKNGISVKQLRHDKSGVDLEIKILWTQEGSNL